MIIISILIHIMGNYSPKWILPKVKHNNPIIKLTGLFTDFLVAFLICFFIHLLSPKTYYIDNKDAIYGLEFNDTMKQLGFKDGDKIISINNQAVKDINKIIIDILMNPKPVIKIKRQNTDKEIKITDNNVMKIIHSEGTPIKVKLTPNIGEDKIKEIKQTEEKFSIKNVLKSYQYNIKGAYEFFTPKRGYRKLLGFNLNLRGFRGALSLLAFCSTIVGVLNLLPLPGFSLGNFVVSVIELKRGKTFNLRKKNIVSVCTVFVIIIFIFYLY